MKYLFGVDGGNTKTDYFLFDIEGNLIDKHRSGTCSHEALHDSFSGAKRIMQEEITKILSRNNLKPEDISASCFGLAGCDIPSQKANLEKIVGEIGFSNFVICNDAFLGVKAGTTSGYGVCSINGTGTNAGGIDKHGKILQVGGIGNVVSDLAGGRQISRDVMTKVYDEAFRFGEKTSLTPITFKALGISDRSELLEAISTVFYPRSFDYTKLTIACFEEAGKGDKVARQILEDMGEVLGRNAAAAIDLLDLGDHPEVVMIGSVYVKGATPFLNDAFKKSTNKYSKKECDFKLLSVPPATGAIIWAKEIYDGAFPSQEVRNKIIKQIEAAL